MSCGHLNPAITIGALVAGSTGSGNAIKYIVFCLSMVMVKNM
ncbi:MAG: aquaporin [Candidatus Latescibacteria bacterium]|nr:aquaporin [Candidatus Latescibacterota bacterium]